MGALVWGLCHQLRDPHGPFWNFQKLHGDRGGHVSDTAHSVKSEP